MMKKNKEMQAIPEIGIILSVCKSLKGRSLRSDVGMRMKASVLDRSYIAGRVCP